MKTANEILFSGDFNANLYGCTQLENIRKAINEARKEAIKECAKVARTRTNDESTSIIVDKQSILKLIDELK